MEKGKIKPGSYHLSVHDNVIPTDLQDQVRVDMASREWCVHFYDHAHSLFYPQDQSWKFPREHPSGPRCPLAWDERSLEHRNNTVYKLWLNINEYFGNRFAIEGVPEHMSYMTGISPLPAITRPDGSPGKPSDAWRVYGDGMLQERRGHTKSIHRDSIYLDQDCYYTMVYFCNKHWDPQLYGETIFHSSDADTGDFTGKYENDQPRNYPIGDIENIVAPRPGRIMLYDARYLHQQKNIAMYATESLMVVSFRIKRIAPW
jgi:hypothetical protein